MRDAFGEGVTPAAQVAAYVSIRKSRTGCPRQHTSAYVSMLGHTTPEAQPACSRGVWEAEVGFEVGGRFELAEASSARRSLYLYALQCR